MDARYSYSLFKACAALKKKDPSIVEFSAEEAELKKEYLRWLRKAAKIRRQALKREGVGS